MIDYNLGLQRCGQELFRGSGTSPPWVKSHYRTTVQLSKHFGRMVEVFPYQQACANQVGLGRSDESFYLSVRNQSLGAECSRMIDYNLGLQRCGQELFRGSGTSPPWVKSHNRKTVKLSKHFGRMVEVFPYQSQKACDSQVGLGRLDESFLLNLSLKIQCLGKRCSQMINYKV